MLDALCCVCSMHYAVYAQHDACIMLCMLSACTACNRRASLRVICPRHCVGYLPIGTPVCTDHRSFPEYSGAFRSFREGSGLVWEPLPLLTRPLLAALVTPWSRLGHALVTPWSRLGPALVPPWSRLGPADMIDEAAGPRASEARLCRLGSTRTDSDLPRPIRIDSDRLGSSEADSDRLGSTRADPASRTVRTTTRTATLRAGEGRGRCRARAAGRPGFLPSIHPFIHTHTHTTSFNANLVKGGIFCVEDYIYIYIYWMDAGPAPPASTVAWP
jgi:hypothetical protein